MGGGAAHMEAATMQQDQLLGGMGGGAAHMEAATQQDQLLGEGGDGEQGELLAAVEEALQLWGMAGPQNPARKYRSRPRTKQPRFGETPLFPPILCLFNIILRGRDATNGSGTKNLTKPVATLPISF